MQEAARAVDGVHHPNIRRIAGSEAVFLAEEAVLGKGRGDAGADQGLDLPVRGCRHVLAVEFHIDRKGLDLAEAHTRQPAGLGDDVAPGGEAGFEGGKGGCHEGSGQSVGRHGGLQGAAGRNAGVSSSGLAAAAGHETASRMRRPRDGAPRIGFSVRSRPWKAVSRKPGGCLRASSRCRGEITGRPRYSFGGTPALQETKCSRWRSPAVHRLAAPQGASAKGGLRTAHAAVIAMAFLHASAWRASAALMTQAGNAGAQGQPGGDGRQGVLEC